MALTPEDVVNKRFQPTKFREGYDQDEVDDFLDEVVVELRRLTQENEELKQRLAAAEARTGEAPVAPAALAAAPVVEALAAPVTAAVPLVDSSIDEAQSTNNLLQLARRLHEEHVREGAEKRDALIAEGQATAARLVANAEQKQQEQLAALEEQRSTLQKKIDELRGFERDYRTKLKSYIEGQLRDLETTGSGAAALTAEPTSTTGGAAAEPSTPSFQSFGA